MRYIIIFFINLFAAPILFSQDNVPWIRFVDPKNRLAGFKDPNGNTMIPARYENYFVADTFHNIIPLREKIGNTYEAFYLLKDGRKVAYDSLYIFDGYDCESEGKILYKDRKKDRIGYLDKNGEAIIPAIYNTASSFHNGMAIAHINAKRRCWEASDDTTDCERLIWEGGTNILINEKNEILADSLPAYFQKTVDWYSLRVNDPGIDTSIYITLKGKANNNYSFIQFDKEFNKWFSNEFLASLEANKEKYLFTELTYWSPKTSWKNTSKTSYLKLFPNVLRKETFQENATKKLDITNGEFNDQIMTSNIYRRYYTPCGRYDLDRFPIFNVRISYYSKNQQFDHSETFEFIRTPEGYQLLAAPGRD